MNGLRIKVRTYKLVPVDVVSFRWCGTVTGEDMGKLKCSACHEPIGTEKTFGVAWIGTPELGRSLRLCHNCGVTADLSARNKVGDPSAYCCHGQPIGQPCEECTEELARQMNEEALAGFIQRNGRRA
jgi:hypothetical protein